MFDMMSMLPREKKLEGIQGAQAVSLQRLKLDDTAMLNEILMKIIKVQRLVYSGELNKSLCDNVHSYSDKIEAFEAEDLSLFQFEQIHEAIEETKIDLIL